MAGRQRLLNVNETAQRHLKRDENPWYLCGQHFNAKVTWQPNNKSETGSLFVSKFFCNMPFSQPSADAVEVRAACACPLHLPLCPHATLPCPSPRSLHNVVLGKDGMGALWKEGVLTLSRPTHGPLPFACRVLQFAFSPFAGAARVPALVFSRRCARARRRRERRTGPVFVPCVREHLLHAHR